MTNPLDLRGPEFLSFYVPYVVCVFLLVWLARVLWSRAYEAPASGRWSPGIYPTESDTPAIALLRGGPEEVARTLLGRLVAEGFLIIDDKSLARPPELPRDRSRLTFLEEEALKAGLGSVPAAAAHKALARVTQALTPHLEPIRLELEAAGLAPGPSQRWGYRLLGLVALVMVMGLGVAKLLVAMSRGRGNVGFLILLLFFSFFISVRLMKSPFQTAAGSRYLSWLKQSHKGLMSMVIDGRRPGFGELALAAGIFGIAALPSLQPLHKAFVPPSSSSGSDGGSGCGGGGGCGGGCGGCGG
ncbi:MAG TPA: TIGR04222 domain-containing membrane protein [Thermoanaerobaculia bacterium]|jgi:uncharacterized protein (TIGR04222 family)